MFRLDTLRPSLYALLGCLVSAGVALSLNLPSQIKLGEKGQEAIQMLDSMRRPFLDIKETEVRLMKTADVKSASRDFAKAVESGNSLIGRYRKLAEYNPELSRRVAQLSETYEGWVTAERHLFDPLVDFLPGDNARASREHHILKDLTIASSGFLSTMTVLGDGEKPIHADIDSGRRASHLLLLLSSALFLYLVGLIFFQQRARRRVVERSRDELELQVRMRTASLQDANRHLQEEISRRKQAEKETADFSAMIVHDLRSPLTNIIGVTEMLQEGLLGPIDEKQKKWLRKIEANSRNLVDLVSDFLDLSKLEAGHIDLVKEDTRLDLLVQSTIENYTPLAAEKKIALSSKVSPHLPPIEADPRRLDQVLSNFLSNATKFTKKGGEIEIGANWESGAGHERSEVKFWVKDSGVGIPPEEIGSIFEKYKQGGSGKTSKNKGTGLGLVICKMIVEAHGGKIWVESEERKGTTFFVSLPFNNEKNG